MTFREFKQHATGLRLSDFYLLILYSQAQLESGKGLNSGLAKDYKNLFGMQKPFKRDTVNNGYVIMKDNHLGDDREFLKFTSYNQSIADRILWDADRSSFGAIDYDKHNLWSSLINDDSGDCVWAEVAYMNYMCKVSHIYSEARPESYYDLWMSLLKENFESYEEEYGEKPNGYDSGDDGFNEYDSEDIAQDLGLSEKGGTSGFLGFFNFLFKMPTLVIFLILLALFYYFRIYNKRKGK